MTSGRQDLLHRKGCRRRRRRRRRSLQARGGGSKNGRGHVSILSLAEYLRAQYALVLFCDELKFTRFLRIKYSRARVPA